jgi:DHA1 family bicyclomycin/chloramphenicol resistance-like MFS transporter
MKEYRVTPVPAAMVSETKIHSPLRFGESVALMALMISLAALSIDAMLPALPQIGKDLGVERENDVQLIISFVILGMAIGQMFYGPVSDSCGRKPAIYAGFALFIIGCLISIFAKSFSVMLAGRILQGIGVASPRSLTMAMVRDQFEGRAMARVMSLVMAIFLLVPAIAPALGQGILMIASWRAIFSAFLAQALIACVWLAIRQPETLAPDRRIPFSLRRIALAIREICGNRASLGYTIASGLVFGAFIGYLSTSQQVFQGQYGLGTQFPIYMAVLALSIGCGLFLNSRIVMRHGMRSLTRRSLQTFVGFSILFFAIVYGQKGHPPLWGLMTYLMLSFFSFGVLFGNLNALAMRPLGHIAGVGAAVVGSLSTVISVALGILIGASYNGTVLPIVGGFAILGIMAMAVVRWAEQGVPMIS